MGCTNPRDRPLTNLTHSTEQLSPCCTTSSNSRNILGAIFLPDYPLPESECHHQQQVNTFPITSPTPVLHHPLRQCWHSHHERWVSRVCYHPTHIRFLVSTGLAYGMGQEQKEKAELLVSAATWFLLA